MEHERLAAIRAEHVPYDCAACKQQHCAGCPQYGHRIQGWPCEQGVLLEALAGAEAENERLRGALGVVAARSKLGMQLWLQQQQAEGSSLVTGTLPDLMQSVAQTALAAVGQSEGEG